MMQNAYKWIVAAASIRYFDQASYNSEKALAAQRRQSYR